MGALFPPIRCSTFFIIEETSNRPKKVLQTFQRGMVGKVGGGKYWAVGLWPKKHLGKKVGNHIRTRKYINPKIYRAHVLYSLHSQITGKEARKAENGKIKLIQRFYGAKERSFLFEYFAQIYTRVKEQCAEVGF